MMSETQSKETAVTVKSEPAQTGIQLNLTYFKSIPGILKLVQLVVGILCMALGSPAYVSQQHWFLFVATSAFIGTLIWVFFHFLSLQPVLSFLPINWILSELLYTVVYTVLYIIAFIVEFTPDHIDDYPRFIAAGVFGIVNSAAYGYGSFLLYKQWKGQ